MLHDKQSLSAQLVRGVSDGERKTPFTGGDHSDPSLLKLSEESCTTAGTYPAQGFKAWRH